TGAFEVPANPLSRASPLPQVFGSFTQSSNAFGLVGAGLPAMTA
ncbi:hypothetical protein ACVWYU_005366, partial [Pseudomonas sp. TE12234]